MKYSPAVPRDRAKQTPTDTLRMFPSAVYPSRIEFLCLFPRSTTGTQVRKTLARMSTTVSQRRRSLAHAADFHRYDFTLGNVSSEIFIHQDSLDPMPTIEIAVILRMLRADRIRMTMELRTLDRVSSALWKLSANSVTPRNGRKHGRRKKSASARRNIAAAQRKRQAKLRLQRA